jgi:nitrogenase molybdenum-iron protein NifN
VDSAKRLGIPLLRAGFPQFDLIGGYQKTWIGYQGTRQALFDLANLMLSHHAQLSDSTLCIPIRPKT